MDDHHKLVAQMQAADMLHLMKISGVSTTP
jgi:hypothetical protein